VQKVDRVMIIVVQPGIPTYRVDFFERLARKFAGDFVAYASPYDMGVLSTQSHARNWQRELAEIRHILPGVFWQPGALSIPVHRGDIVVVSGAPRCLTNILFLLKARINGASTVWWGHYLSPTSTEMRQWLRKRLMKLSGAFLFYTEREMLAYKKNNAGIHDGRLFALNNGIDVSGVERLRVPYAQSERQPRVLFIGRLTPKSRLEILLRAMTSAALADVRLEVIGAGEEDRLFAHARELGVADRITWHGGLTDEEAISRVANRCQLFVYPGDVGLSLIHGLAYGLPVIVHEEFNSHMPEIAALSPGENGRTFRKGDAESLAAVLARSLRDEALLNAMSRCAVDTVERTFNTRDMADRFADMVEVLKANALEVRPLRYQP